MPLPYGTRPRLVLFHICSEAIRTKSYGSGNRVLEIKRTLSYPDAAEVSIADVMTQLNAKYGLRHENKYACVPVLENSENP